MKNNKVILKTQQRFKIERHNIFTEEVNKIALSSYDDKRMQSIYQIETHGTHGLVCKGEEIKCNNIIKQNKNVLL